MDRFDQLRQQTDMGAPVTIESLPGTAVVGEAVTCNKVLGVVTTEGTGAPRFFYRSKAFVRYYRVDAAALTAFLAHQHPTQAIHVHKLIGRLQLVNTRNRLTHALVRLLMQRQVEYIASTETVRLRPLSVTEVAACLQVSFQMANADRSRISRLIRGLAIQLPQGQQVALRALCPRARDVHCHLVSHVVRQEQALLVQGILLAPLIDAEVAQWIWTQFRQRVSRRAVAYIRRQLGVPRHRDRIAGSGYVAATSGFSSLLPFTVDTVQDAVMPIPGVYEVRRAPGASQPENNGAETVLYVGSTSNLRKRLLDHLRGDNSNGLLQGHFRHGALCFRYRVIEENWREVERAVYQAYCQTFGKPPVCNLMSP